MRWRRAAVAVTSLALLTITGACGSDSPRSAVADAGASLGRIHSGVMHLTLELATAPDDPSARVGFQLDGSFDLGADTPLPVADLTVTNLSEPSKPTTRFLSTGQVAFIVEDGVGYQLDDTQTARLRRDTASNGSGTLAGLDLGSWVVDPVEQRAASGSGGDTETITGTVDPVAALNGIASLAGRLGAGGGSTSVQVAANEEPRVRAAVRSSSFEVVTGTSDHLLRTLRATVEFAAPKAAATSSGAVLEALDRVGHVTLEIDLRLDAPNAPVTVQAPANVRPIAELPR